MGELLKLIDPETKTETYFEEYLASSPKASLILIHGMGAPTQRWVQAAQFFTKRGYHCYCLGLKGYGRAPGSPGDIASFKVYYNDIRFLISYAKKKLDAPIFLMGESLGALVGLGFELFLPRLSDGVVALSPALKDKLDISIFKKLGLVALLLIKPNYPFKMPWNPEMITRDQDSLRILKTDQDEQHHVASPRMLLWYLITRAKVLRCVKKLNTPVLVVQGGVDKLMDYRAAEQFAKNLKNFGTYLFYPQMYHGLSVDLDREKMFADIDSWLNKKIQEISKS